MYKSGDTVRIKDNLIYELPSGQEVTIPEGASVEIDAFHENGAINAETHRPIDQVSFIYDGHLVRVGVECISRLAS